MRMWMLSYFYIGKGLLAKGCFFYTYLVWELV